MSVTKIQRVNSLTHTVNYITRQDKTENDLIHSFNCNTENIKRNFDNVLVQYNELNGTERELKPRMIVQSFSPDENINPEQAHEYGKEFVKNYLNDEFQYILATHHDEDHIHNHIVFNDINYKTLDVFDSSRENTLHRMRNENDLVSEKYGLQIIEQTRQKHKYLTHKDYVVRAKGNSFKEQIENDIDQTIEESNSYNSFLESMKKKGYKIKEGKHLSFKSPTGKKFMRTKTLGFNYLENSIKYRINNKDYIPFKPKIAKRNWIDKSQQKFQENKGLHRWATLQNINYLHEVNNVLSKENISLKQFSEEQKTITNLNKKLERKLSQIDNQINKIENMSNSFKNYKESYSLMIGFKKLNTQEEKDKYKKQHFNDFKKYDLAKKDINVLKKAYQINNQEQLKEKIENLVAERNLIYESVNLNKEQEKDKKQQQQREQQNKKKRDNRLEL